MEMSVEIFKEFFEKCVAIARTKGYDPDDYSYTYLDWSDGEPSVVFINDYSDDSDDRNYVQLNSKDFELDLDELVAKYKAEEEEKKRKAELDRKKWENQRKAAAEEHDKKEWERLKKKFGENV